MNQAYAHQIESIGVSYTPHQYKLMLKCHWETGINYLCITKRKDFKKYKGSGVRWRALLKKHPSIIFTHLLFSTDSLEELRETCIYYSHLFDVVNNPDFSNLIPEYGYEENENNLKLWLDSVDLEVLQEMYKRRRNTLKQNHFLRKDGAEIIKNKISMSNAINWKKSLEQFLIENPDKNKNDFNIIKMQKLWEAAKFKFDNLTEIEYINYCNKLSTSVTKMWSEMSESERIRRGKAISETKLNATSEQKSERNKKFSTNYEKDETGKYKSDKVNSYVERMKIDRKSGGNPAAVAIVYKNIRYDCKRDLLKLLSSDEKRILESLLLDPAVIDCYYIGGKKSRIYDVGICPYCNASGNMTSSFKRWHFENCKMK